MSRSEDAIRQKILSLIVGMDRTALSKKMGRGSTYLRDFLHRGHPRELSERDRRTLAALLGVNERELRTQHFDEPDPDEARLTIPRRGGPMITEQRDLPILGYGKGGSEGHFLDNGEIAGFTLRPSHLLGVKDAYAVEMWNTSMEPAIRHGHVCWVHPRKTVQPGDDVVVQLKDGQALIKTLHRRTDKNYQFQQYNPPDIIEIKKADVKDIHLIIGSLRVRT